jgi:hypothetical protein
MQYQQQHQQMVMQHNGHYMVSIPQPSPSKVYAPKRLPYYERKQYTEQRRVI